MSENVLKSYQNISHHPDKLHNLDTVGSVLHAVCAAKGFSWKETYECLIETSGEIGLMPQYRKTIRKMLENQGFFLQAGAYANRSVNSIIEECNQNFHDGEVVILNVSNSVTYGCYIPLVPVVQDGNVRYPMAVFGYPDAFKLRSCMALFKHTAPEQELFQKVLDKFCRGDEDEKTLDKLGL